jgi:hypothetical protein
MKITKRQLNRLISTLIKESYEIGKKSDFNVTISDEYILDALRNKDRAKLKEIGFVETADHPEIPGYMNNLKDWYAKMLNCHRDDLLAIGRFTSGSGWKQPGERRGEQVVTADMEKAYRQIVSIILRDETAVRKVFGPSSKNGIFPPKYDNHYPDHENVLAEIDGGSIKLVQSLSGMGIKYALWPTIIVCAPENKEIAYYV